MMNRRLLRAESSFTAKRHKNFRGTMEMFYILTVMIVKRIYTFVKTQIHAVKIGDFLFYLSKAD